MSEITKDMRAFYLKTFDIGSSTMMSVIKTLEAEGFHVNGILIAKELQRIRKIVETQTNKDNPDLPDRVTLITEINVVAYIKCSTAQDRTKIFHLCVSGGMQPQTTRRPYFRENRFVAIYPDALQYQSVRNISVDKNDCIVLDAADFILK